MTNQPDELNAREVATLKVVRSGGYYMLDQMQRYRVKQLAERGYVNLNAFGPVLSEKGRDALKGK